MLLAVAAACLGACPGGRTRKALTGCAKDTDCKGARVCDQGQCVEPVTDGTTKRVKKAPDAGTKHEAGSPPFAMARGDARHRGRTAGSPPAKEPKQVWKYAAKDVIFASPTIGPDENVYIGSHDGSVYAIAPDGTMRWSFAAEDRVWTTPAVASDGTVYFGSDDDHLYAVDKDGKLKWKFRAGDCDPPKGFGPEGVRCDVDGGPTLGPDGTIYFGADGVYAVWPDGSLRWKFATPSHMPTAPAIADDGTLYAGGHDDALYAIGTDGTKRWEFRIRDDIESSPMIGDDGTIYFGADDHKLYAVAPDGQQKWAVVTQGDVRSSPALGLDGTIYVGSFDRSLYAVSPEGSVEWRFGAADKLHGSPVVAKDGSILIGSEDDHVYVLEPDGRLRYYLTLDDDVDASPAITTGGTIYVAGDDGTLRAFRK